MLRVVLDTNVLVSAIISNGRPRQLVKKGISNQFSIVTSESILQELAKVIHRPKFKTSEEEIRRITLALRRTAEFVDVQSKLVVVADDPKDDMIINTAIDGCADLIVSGDKHLLCLESYHGIRIVNVETALRLL